MPEKYKKYQRQWRYLDAVTLSKDNIQTCGGNRGVVECYLERPQLHKMLIRDFLQPRCCTYSRLLLSHITPTAPIAFFVAASISYGA